MRYCLCCIMVVVGVDVVVVGVDVVVGVFIEG